MSKENPSKKIKLGLISQSSSFINVYSIFYSYLENAKLKYYNIRDENHYEFCYKSLPDFAISINHFKDGKDNDNNNKYKIYNFFLIFIDIQKENNKTNIFLEKTIERIISANKDDFNKKYYIFGFYENDEKERINKDKIGSILESKGIEYLYNEIKKDSENFGNKLKFIINDCITIMTEKFLAQKQIELIPDESRSKCFLF